MPRTFWVAVVLILGAASTRAWADMAIKLSSSNGSTAVSVQNASAVEVSSITSLGDGYFRNVRASTLYINNTVAISTSGHLVGGGGTPTIGATTSAGSVTPTITGTDTAGEITVATGGSAVGGLTVTVTFNSAYASAPYVTLTPSNANTSGLLTQVLPVAQFVTSTATTFVLNTAGAGTLLASSTYKWHYHVIQ